jgi:hypothetical protein
MVIPVEEPNRMNIVHMYEVYDFFLSDFDVLDHLLPMVALKFLNNRMR